MVAMFMFNLKCWKVVFINHYPQKQSTTLRYQQFIHFFKIVDNSYHRYLRMFVQTRLWINQFSLNFP